MVQSQRCGGDGVGVGWSAAGGRSGEVEEDVRHLVGADAGFGGHDDDAFDGGWWVALRVGGEGVVYGLEDLAEAVDA